MQAVYSTTIKASKIAFDIDGDISSDAIIKYRYSYHPDLEMWSDWISVSTINEISDKTFREGEYVSLEISIEAEDSSAFPDEVYVYSAEDDVTCNRQALTVNENTTGDGDDDDEECVASVKVVECDEDNIFNPYSTGSASTIYNELSSIVSDTFGIEVRYFRTSPVKESADYIFHEYSLKNVSSVNNIKILIENNNLPSRAFTINSPLIDYQQTLTAHIVKDQFRASFGNHLKVYPREHDYLYIGFSNFHKLYEVIGVYEPDDFLYTASYWIVLLQPFQSRSMVGFDLTDETAAADAELARTSENSDTVQTESESIVKENELVVFNERQEMHIADARRDAEKARASAILNDKVPDNMRKLGIYNIIKMNPQIENVSYKISHRRVKLTSYYYNMTYCPYNRCAILYKGAENREGVRVSFFIKLTRSFSTSIPILSCSAWTILLSPSSIDIQYSDTHRKRFAFKERLDDWSIFSIQMDEDDLSMLSCSQWNLKYTNTSNPMFVAAEVEKPIVIEQPLNSKMDMPDEAEICLYGGPFQITNIKIADRVTPLDHEFADAIASVAQCADELIVSDNAMPVVDCETLSRIRK